uniref:Uncharacterized protein n=1 Tax=Anguilla anguilla TaxID=7936 RepID=A0A0E9UQK0_ANGAN
MWVLMLTPHLFQIASYWVKPTNRLLHF